MWSSLVKVNLSDGDRVAPTLNDQRHVNPFVKQTRMKNIKSAAAWCEIFSKSLMILSF